MNEVVLPLPNETANQQRRDVLEHDQLIGHVALPFPMMLLMPEPRAVTNVTVVERAFGLCPSACSMEIILCGVQQGFLLEEGSVFYLFSTVFSTAKLRLAPVTTGSLTLC